jgi:hypothetical protein
MQPNLEYIAARDALIPEAEEIARQRVKEIGKKGNWRKGVDGKKFKYDYFTREFHLAMDNLVKEKIWGAIIVSSTTTGNAETVNISTVSESLLEQPVNVR